MQLSPEQCSDFYADQYGKLFFPSLTAFMSSGPIIAMTLARHNAIAHWRSILGPVNSTKARETHPGWSVSEIAFDSVLCFVVYSFNFFHIIYIMFCNGDWITALKADWKVGWTHLPGLWSLPKEIFIFIWCILPPASEQYMALLTLKMLSMAAGHFMQLKERSNSCSKIVSNTQPENVLWMYKFSIEHLQLCTPHVLSLQL